MKVWLICYPRPIGIEPKIYKEKPQIPSAELVEVEPGYFLSDPFFPSIEEFENELAARRYMKEHYPMAYKDLKCS